MIRTEHWDRPPLYREAARQLGMVLIEQPLQTQDEAQTVLARLRKGDVDGIISPRPLSLNIPGFILDTASQQDIPTMFHTPFWVDRSGLVSDGPDFRESGRMAARLVDKIMKGENPANIPVEVNPKIEFVINLRTAKTLGLTLARHCSFTPSTPRAGRLNTIHGQWPGMGCEFCESSYPIIVIGRNWLMSMAPHAIKQTFVQDEHG